MSTIFEVRHVGVHYGDAQLLRDATLQFSTGEFAAIAGPNGAGKSTLVNVLAGMLAPSSGECLFRGLAIAAWKRRDFARQVAVVQQTEAGAFPFLVSEIVRMGRTPHSNGFYESAEDRRAVERAVELAGVAPFLNRDFRTLSGGERQRVLLASALAQDPEVLLLDEPANHLDLQHQLALHRLLRQLRDNGLLVIAVTHDLNLAAAYADRMIVMKQGQIVADGSPCEIMHAHLVTNVFEIRAEIHVRENGRPWLLYGD